MRSLTLSDVRTTVVGTPWREPGLGLSLRHDVCVQHSRTGGQIRLFEEGWEQRGFGAGRVQ